MPARVASGPRVGMVKPTSMMLFPLDRNDGSPC
jgi:hypothetical protein